MVVYRIEVETGDNSGAGTEAAVYITLTGERGDSGARRLYSSSDNSATMFSQGKVEHFSLFNKLNILIALN